MANPVRGWMDLSGPLPNLWMRRKRLCGEGKGLIFLGSHLASLVFLLSRSELLPACSSNWWTSYRKAAPWIHLHASKASTEPGSHWKWKLLSRVRLCDPMDCIVHGILQARILEYFPGEGSCSILQGIFPTLGSNPGLPHCRQILYQLNHQGRPPGSNWFLINSG